MKRTKEQMRVDKRRNQIVYRENLRKLVLSHYGGGTPVCSRCGYGRDLKALGLYPNKNTKAPRVYGDNLLQLLKNDGFPSGYKILCANCRAIKGYRTK